MPGYSFKDQIDVGDGRGTDKPPEVSYEKNIPTAPIKKDGMSGSAKPIIQGPNMDEGMGSKK